MKKLTLCADDFGYNDSVSMAVLELIDLNRLSATSCMTDFPAWKKYAGELKRLESKCNIGLHFNLTDNIPCDKNDMQLYPSLGVLMLKSLFGRIDKSYIEEEFNRQIEKFITEFGRLPDFIDGHQHVHQFPAIQDVIIKQIKQYYSSETYPIIRVTAFVVAGKIDPLKSLIIANFGAKSFRSKLKSEGIPFNSAFAGIYDFRKSKNYPEYFKCWLTKMPDSTLMMCHPGLLVDKTDSDPIYAGRFHEYSFLKSAEFKLIIEEKNVSISRL